MTLEDFIESAVAGWMPLAWHSLVHYVVIGWRWVLLHLGTLVLVLAARRR
jgi:hypothetical protein